MAEHDCIAVTRILNDLANCFHPIDNSSPILDWKNCFFRLSFQESINSTICKLASCVDNQNIMGSKTCQVKCLRRKFFLAAF